MRSSPTLLLYQPKSAEEGMVTVLMNRSGSPSKERSVTLSMQLTDSVLGRGKAEVTSCVSNKANALRGPRLGAGLIRMAHTQQQQGNRESNTEEDEIKLVVCVWGG